MSGGKDSTALLHLLLKWKQPIDEIIFFDGGWEWPQILRHLKLVEKKTGRKITRLKPEQSFDEHMFLRPIRKKTGKRKGEIHRLGAGWPTNRVRWCTGIKVCTIRTYIKNNYPDDMVEYIGFAADERHRARRKNAKLKHRFPLIELGYSEADCLALCYDLGYTFGGLYKHMDRLGCRCCSLKRLGELRKIRKHYPKVWCEMLEKEDHIPRCHHHGFGGRTATLHEIDARFTSENFC